MILILSYGVFESKFFYDSVLFKFLNVYLILEIFSDLEIVSESCIEVG